MKLTKNQKYAIYAGGAVILLSIIFSESDFLATLRAFVFLGLCAFAVIYVLKNMGKPEAQPIKIEEEEKYKTHPELQDIGMYFEYAHAETKSRNLSGEKLTKFNHESFKAYIASLPNFGEYGLNWQKNIYLASFKSVLAPHERELSAKVDIPIFFWSKGHLATIAASRSGKGACQIIPNLLLPLDNSYIVLDIKGENAAVTARYQQNIGREVHIIDPFNEQERIGATHGIEPSGFNPLHSLDLTSPDFFDDVTSIVEAVTPLDNDKDQFWIKRARALIRGLIIYHVTSEPKENWTLSNIYKVLRSEAAILMANISMGADNEHSQTDLAQFKGLIPSENKTFGSILDTALAATEFMRIYLKTDNLTKTFDQNQISKKPTTVYIVIPQDKLDNYFLWLRLMVSITLTAARKNMTSRRVVFMLDEFPQLGKMDIITKGLGLLAGFNITIWLFAQNITQLKAIYGDSWETLLDVKSKMFYKISDKATLEYVSKLLGYEVKKKKSISQGNSNSNTYSEKNSSTRGDSFSTTYSEATELRMHPNQVATLLNKFALIFKDGKDHEIEMIPYFELNDTKDNADKNPLII